MQKHPSLVGGFYFSNWITGGRCPVLFDRPPVAPGPLSKPRKMLVEITVAIEFIRRNQIKLAW
jgi:hypothetical protein